MADVNAPMMVIRKLLTPEEGQPTDTRYNPDTDTVETSPDGGTTWTPNPGADPRSNPAYLRPALAADHACQAADGMVTKMRGFVAALVLPTGVAGIATAILSGMVFLIPLSWMFALALGIATAALLTGASVINAAFTEEVWEQIKCIIFDNIDSNGQVSQAQLDDIYDSVASQISDFVVTTIVGQIFQAWGAVGMSNAGTYGDPDADCSDCPDEWCANFDFEAGGGTTYSYTIQAGYGSLGADGITSGYFPPPEFAGTEALYITWNMPTPVTVTLIELDVTYPASANNTWTMQFVTGTGYDGIPGSGTFTIPIDNGGLGIVLSETGIYLQAYPLSAGTPIKLHRMRWYGDGDFPAVLSGVPAC